MLPLTIYCTVYTTLRVYVNLDKYTGGWKCDVAIHCVCAFILFHFSKAKVVLIYLFIFVLLYSVVKWCGLRQRKPTKANLGTVYTTGKLVKFLVELLSVSSCINSKHGFILL